MMTNYDLTVKQSVVWLLELCKHWSKHWSKGFNSLEHDATWPTWMAKTGDVDLQLPTMHYLPPMKQSMSNQTECCSPSFAAHLLQNLPEKTHSVDLWKPASDDHLLEAERTLWWHWGLCPTTTCFWTIFKAAVASIRRSICWRIVINTAVLIWRILTSMQPSRQKEISKHHGIQANAERRRHTKAATTDQVPDVLLREAENLGDTVLYICSTLSLLMQV